LDKYLPVRTQQLIYDTLNASLEDRPRVNHNAYYQDCMVKMYGIIIDDKGEGLRILEQIK